MDIEEKEFEALQAEKRDRMNSRWQVWSILVGLAGAFGLASLQSGYTGYVVALFPILAACLARFSGHSESILDQIKAYLLEVEARHTYSGYEAYNATHKRRTSGGHTKALRDAICCTDLLASAVLLVHLYSDHMPILALILAALIECAAIGNTIHFLRK